MLQLRRIRTPHRRQVCHGSAAQTLPQLQKRGAFDRRVPHKIDDTTAEVADTSAGAAGERSDRSDRHRWYSCRNVNDQNTLTPLSRQRETLRN